MNKLEIEAKAMAVVNSDITAYRIYRDSGVSKTAVVRYRRDKRITTYSKMVKLSAYYDWLVLQGYATKEAPYKATRLPARGL